MATLRSTLLLLASCVQLLSLLSSLAEANSAVVDVEMNSYGDTASSITNDYSEKKKSFPVANATKSPEDKNNDDTEFVADAEEFQFQADASLLTYLDLKWLQDEERVNEVSENLKAGNLVVIRDAFKPEFAEWAWRELQRDDLNYSLKEGAYEDGFSFYHHNVVWENFTSIMWNIYDMFNHPDSKDFISHLSGRDCHSPNITGSSSRYFPGDYSLPHSDFDDSRSVSYVWHLTKDWNPSWGGALYWANGHANRPFIHASFNTLSLFSVTPYTSHFVTQVWHEAEGKRLAFNGWYDSDLAANLEMAESLEPENFPLLTYWQMELILNMDLDAIQDDEVRYERVLSNQNALRHYLGTEFPSEAIYET